jgi:F-type H+-transporting ATPase subunit b
VGVPKSIQMAATLNALRDILLKAIPTFLLVLFLHFYLKKIFFNPLERIIRQRYEATEGARLEAMASLQEAEAKTAEYQAALREARAEIYREQEAARKQWRQEQDSAARNARAEAVSRVEAAKAGLAAEAEQARLRLATEGQDLASRIAETILRPRRSGI